MVAQAYATSKYACRGFTESLIADCRVHARIRWKLKLIATRRADVGEERDDAHAGEGHGSVPSRTSVWDDGPSDRIGNTCLHALASGGADA